MFRDCICSVTLRILKIKVTNIYLESDMSRKGLLRSGFGTAKHNAIKQITATDIYCQVKIRLVELKSARNPLHASTEHNLFELMMTSYMQLSDFWGMGERQEEHI